MYENGDPTEAALTRLRASKDFRLIDLLISALRSAAPRSMTTRELVVVLGCSKGKAYGVVKLARRYLALLGGGEIIPNLPKVGYRLVAVSVEPRAGLFESIKSGDRADGHLAQEMAMFRRIKREDLKRAEDLELFVLQQGRIRMGEARMAMSGDMKAAMLREQKNVALVTAAHRASLTPWQDLGLDDPDDGSN